MGTWYVLEKPLWKIALALFAFVVSEFLADISVLGWQHWLHRQRFRGRRSLRRTFSRLLKPHGHLFPSLGMEGGEASPASACLKSEESPQTCCSLNPDSMMG